MISNCIGNVIGSSGLGAGGPQFLNEYSFLFDGVDEGILSDSGAFDITGAFSVSFRFKGGTPAIARTCFIARDTTAGVNRDFNIIFRSTGDIDFLVWNTSGASTTAVATAGGWDDNTWHHCVCTYDGTSDANKMIIYVDNSVAGTGTASSTGTRNTQVPIGIGTLSANNNWRLNGQMDEVAIWDSELSASEVSEIYNGGAPIDLTSYSPLLWWRMGDGATWDTTNWSFPDLGSAGIGATSANMEEGDRVSDVPT